MLAADGPATDLTIADITAAVDRFFLSYIKISLCFSACKNYFRLQNQNGRAAAIDIPVASLLIASPLLVDLTMVGVSVAIYETFSSYFYIYFCFSICRNCISNYKNCNILVLATDISAISGLIADLAIIDILIAMNKPFLFHI